MRFIPHAFSRGPERDCYPRPAAIIRDSIQAEFDVLALRIPVVIFGVINRFLWPAEVSVVVFHQHLSCSS